MIMIKKYNAIQITIYWTATMLSIGVIGGMIANHNASGGEQKLFTYVAYSLMIALIGVVLINIGMLFLSKAQSMNTRLFSLSFIVLALFVLYPLIRGVMGDKYDVVEKTRYIGPEKIDIKIEYYSTPDTSRIIRSRSFWKNGKRDSVWIIYDRSGNIVKQQKYKEDILIETIH